MPTWQHYLQPQSVDEALQSLQTAPCPVKIIAGGTDLLIDLQQGRHPPVSTLVDVSCIPEMSEIRDEDGIIQLGAAVTHAEIVRSPLLARAASCLVEACGLIGGPQVRNVATLGGNVAHALPAGDGTIALLALGADAQVAGPGGVRWLPVENLFLAPGRTVLDGKPELLLGFRFPMPGPGEASAFQRVMRPQGVAIAILNMAVHLRAISPPSRVGTACVPRSGKGAGGLGSEAGGSGYTIRLAVGPAGPVPFRARRTEALLAGRQIDEETLALAAAELASEVRLRASAHRATLDYRQHLLPILLRRVLEAALNRMTVD